MINKAAPKNADGIVPRPAEGVERANHLFRYLCWYLFFASGYHGGGLGMALKELPKPALTRREREVAALVAEGLTNREIAERLYLSPRTVEKHIAALLAKLDTPDRTALTQLARSLH